MSGNHAPPGLPRRSGMIPPRPREYTHATAVGYNPIEVGKCKVQSADARFGEGAFRTIAEHEAFYTDMPPWNSSAPSSEDEDEADEAISMNISPPPEPRLPRIPKLQNLRNNLTALSQRYNLYMAAYRSRITIYCPRNAHIQALERNPALVLRPEAHPHATEGHMHQSHGHEINNMKTGLLGDVEIVLFAYDDGDAIAYYTKDIADHIVHRRQFPRTAKPLPRPFFHENVGMSAWGLAIHSLSRLVAVSSNKHEVTVFAFALTQPNGFVLRRHPTKTEATVLARKRNWRIVLLLGPGGHNIPDIDFICNADGYAVKVCAIDINSNMWLVDIWREQRTPACVRFHAPGPFPRDCLWGILALPRQAFARTGNGTGRPERSAQDKTISLSIDLLPSMRIVEHVEVPFSCGRHYYESDDSSEQDWTLQDEDEDEDEDEENDKDKKGEKDEAKNDAEVSGPSSGEEEEVEPPHDDDDDSLVDDWDIPMEDLPAALPFSVDVDTVAETAAAHHNLGVPRPPKGPFPDRRLKRFLPLDRLPLPPTSMFDRLGMIYKPSEGKTFREPHTTEKWMAWLQRPNEISAASKPQRSPVITDDFAILVTTETDIRLVTSGPYNVRCKNPAALAHSRRGQYEYSRRLNLLAWVPELSLVVAGSQTGRVMLLSLVSQSQSQSQAGPHLCFSVEHILPTREEEEQRVRPNCPLFGVAIGPMQEAVGPVNERQTLDLKTLQPQGLLIDDYRLLLHYRDHTILSYRIRRPMEDLKPF